MKKNCALTSRLPLRRGSNYHPIPRVGIILGREKETVAAGYGEGSPVPMLRMWIDKIGF
jgi:hypothetical protein